MWRLDRKRESEESDPSAEHEGTFAERNMTSPQDLSLGDPTLKAGNIAEPVWQRWRDEIATVGGRSPLLHFADAPRTRIELSTTHPGGLPQFITGRSTLLSSLIRDDLALRNAKHAADAITAKNVELRSMRGIESTHLAIGLAEWRHGEDRFTAPVLLRPVAIRRYGSDFELKLRGEPFLNPQLARALHEQFQIVLDADAFVALAISNGVFKPQPVIDRLRGLTSHLDWFTVRPRLLVSSFADVAGAMTADAADLNHPMLDALAENPFARRQVEQDYHPVETVGQDDRPPATDTLLLDADEEQEDVVAQVAAGNSVVVRTLPGTGSTQTIVNAVGALVAGHKRVLVVGARRSSLDDIGRRLRQIGLDGMAVSLRSLRRDVIQSINRNEKAQSPAVGDVDDALVRLRKVLLDYRTALGRRDPVLGVSVLDALRELSRLASLPHPPATTARLDRDAVEVLAADRSSAADALVKAASLGEFRYGPADSPWYGASFTTTDEATAAHNVAKKLDGSELPRLLERVHALLGQTRMRPFESLTDLGVCLRLLMDVRETLDKFQPSVFDRPLTELIAATAAKRDAPHMSRANRRRLRKLAEEYVRPGVYVTDMNEALRRIQQQRILWQRYAAAGVVPEVPAGTADAQVAFQRVADDIAVLEKPLGRDLMGMPISQLVRMVAGLAVESEVLANLQERTALLSTLRDLRLDPLLADLSERHVDPAHVASELELAWWQSVLEALLASDRALLNANTSVLDRLEADFRLVDDAHASATAAQLAWTLADTWKVGLVDWADEADALRRLLRSGTVSPESLTDAAGHLMRTLAPVWLSSPYEVAALTDRLSFDTVVLVDAGATTLAENVGAIRRARQVVAFGDPVTQTPSRFELGVRENAQQSAADPDTLHPESALAALAELLPTFTLTRSYRAGGEDLAEMVNRRFYSEKIEFLPWAGTFLGHGSLKFHHVADGHGMPDSDSGAVESVDAEVSKVVELVMEHAVKRPRESLMVITASPRHAVRVHQAVLTAFAKRVDLSDFILADRAEPFTVVTLEQSVALSRDRVIFSVGYGRTPHGRLLSNFGPLAEPGGERLLAVGMTRARRSMDIVSCFAPEDIDDERMRHGIVALANVLSEAANVESIEHAPDHSDPMLVDLAHRLDRRGLRVSLGHRGKLPLVASYRGRSVAIETDAALSAGSLRETLRLRPDVLRRLGWHYLRVHSFELFSDPEAVANRVATLIGAPDTMAATSPITVPESLAE